MDAGKIIYNKITSSHDLYYSIYCRMGVCVKVSLFSQGDITNKQGLFYQDNVESKLYKWFLLVKEDISKFNSTASC